MRDLESKRWIVAKGVMFLAISASTASLLLLNSPTPREFVLLVILVWASCRFYYFLFYVLERYVDSRLRYSGVISLLMAVLRQRPPDVE